MKWLLVLMLLTQQVLASSTTTIEGLATVNISDLRCSGVGDSFATETVLGGNKFGQRLTFLDTRPDLLITMEHKRASAPFCNHEIINRLKDHAADTGFGFLRGVPISVIRREFAVRDFSGRCLFVEKSERIIIDLDHELQLSSFISDQGPC